MLIPIIIAIFAVLPPTEGSTYQVSTQFFTNHFTNNDCTPWTTSGGSVPAMMFTSCGTVRLFGGYQVFMGNQISPTETSRTWTNLIPHFSVRIRALLYKIDSWPSNTLFIRVDGTTTASFTFDNTNPGTSDICGINSPITDTINTNYNQNIINIDSTVSHSASSLTVSLISNLAAATGSWGIRQLNITMEACDQSSACLSCETGLVLSGSYCVCSTGIRRKIIPCSLYPCVSCIATCSAGSYLSTLTTYCQPCSVACSACTSASNTITSCSSCSSGYIGNPIGGTVCQSCFSGCLTCTSISSTACLTCKYQYFFFAANNSCLSVCPNGYYGEQKTARCFLCSSPCANCMGTSFLPNTCISCVTGYYLQGNTCSLQCPNSMFGYLGSCYSSCPTTTLADTGTYTCNPCIANCAECSTISVCSKCSSNAYLLSGGCYLTCPTSYYADTSTLLCLICQNSCLTCNGPNSTNCLSCVSGSAVLSGSCYTSCPNNTYSSLCLPCDSTCLSCSGPSQSECLSCASPLFFHLNYSTCVSNCIKGQLAHNLNLTCSICQSGQTANYQTCLACDPSCLSCNGPTFLECQSCNYNTEMVVGICVLQSSKKIIYTPDISSQSLNFILQTVLVCYIAVSIFLEVTFCYKTNLLPTLELLQILSYTYYLNIKLTQNTQRTALLLYYSNFSHLIRPFVGSVNPLTPPKFQIMGKTGYFSIDALGVHICLIGVIVIHLGARHLGKRFKMMATFYNKINPYLIAYTFRLVFLQFSLDFLLYLSSFEVSSGLGLASLGLLILDVLVLAFVSFWRIRTATDGSQIALLYNNQIGERSSSQKVYEEEQTDTFQSRIQKNIVLPSILIICCKLPVPLIILTFIDHPLAQCGGLTLFYVLCLLLTIMLPFRRRIFRFIMVFSSSILILNGIVSIVVEKGVSSYSFDLLWLIAIIVSLLIVVLQGVVNYNFFVQFFSYSLFRVRKWWYSEETLNENEESQSNLTGESQSKPEGRVMSNYPKNYTKDSLREDEQSKTGKIRSNNLSSYLHLTHSKYPTEEDVELDLNL